MALAVYNFLIVGMVIMFFLYDEGWPVLRLEACFTHYIHILERYEKFKYSITRYFFSLNP